MAQKLEVTFELNEIDYTCEVVREGYLNNEPDNQPTYDIDLTKVIPGYRIDIGNLATVISNDATSITKRAIEEYEQALDDHLNDDSYDDVDR